MCRTAFVPITRLITGCTCCPLSWAWSGWSSSSPGDAGILGHLILFFFTGEAVVIYLNQAGLQPRERDYAYAGAMYAFAIWIGLGVIWVKELLEKYALKKQEGLSGYAAAGLCFLAVPVLMCSQNGTTTTEAKRPWPGIWPATISKAVRQTPFSFPLAITIPTPYGMHRKWKASGPNVRVMVNTTAGYRLVYEPAAV